MKKTFLLCLSLACSSIWSVDLDLMMNAKEQQETGYSSLSKEEKKALNQWLTKNLVPVQGPTHQKSLSLDVNIQSGKQLILSDKSRWEVAPEDQKVSSLWLTPIALVLVENGSKEYPKTLINQENPGESVKVRPAL